MHRCTKYLDGAYCYGVEVQGERIVKLSRRQRRSGKNGAHYITLLDLSTMPSCLMLFS